MKNNIVIIILVAAVMGGLGFFGGMKYQESRRPAFLRQLGNGGGTRNGNNTGFRPVAGEIIGSDDKSVTVKLQDGSSKIVILSDSTQINKASQGTRQELKTGENIVVFGSTNSDGSVTAQSIQLGATMMMRGSGDRGNRIVE